MDPMSVVPLLPNRSDDEKELDLRRQHGDQLTIDSRMSAKPRLPTSSDKEQLDCESDRRFCCLPLCRWFYNDKDTSFTPGEISSFDKMARSYNLANFTKMNTYRAESPGECLLLYFLANFEIVQGNSSDGNKYVEQGLQVAKQFPRKHDLYFLLLASPRARVLYMDDDIDGLRHLLDICFEKIDALGRGSVPRSVLGWLYYMRARSHKNYKSAAIANYELAIDAFRLSNTSDKDFGVGHTICRLIICILGCGEKADTVDKIEAPFPEEMRRVESLIQEIEKMAVVGQNPVITIIYLMARSDYSFRKRHFRQTLDQAREAHELAVECNCLEFLEVTKERLEVYTKQCSDKPKVHRIHAPSVQQNVTIGNVSVFLGNDNTQIFT